MWRDEKRMRTRIMTIGIALAATVGTIGATTGASYGKPKAPTTGTGSTGSALVFQVNPVQSTGDQSLTDAKDAASAVPAEAYAGVELRHLDGSGYLRGDYVTVQSSTGTPAYSTTNTFHYDRADDRFEQVMAYYWVTTAQEYLQGLGFGAAGTGLPGILTDGIDVKIGQFGLDNSYQRDKPFQLRFGKGGVDDAEDAEVVVHEYGHAVHQGQVPGFGTSLDAGAIGEAFGDYFAVSVGLATAADEGWPVAADPTCVADWDAVSYTEAPHCLRSVGTDLTVDDRKQQVHFDGQIWSGALWSIRESYEALGLGSRAWDTTLIASQFDYAADTSWSAAAAATYASALERDGQAAADAVRAGFAARGIVF